MNYRELRGGQIVRGQKDSYLVVGMLSQNEKTEVYTAVGLEQGLRVVLKKQREGKNKETANSLDREIALYTKIQNAGGHTNIMSPYEIIEDKKMIVSPYSKIGTLRNLHGEMGCFNEQEAIAVVSPLCNAVDFLHSVGIIHRDLKKDNILLEAVDHTLDEIIPEMMADLSTLVVPKIYDLDVGWHQTVAGYDSEGRTYGTPTIMAPEAVRGKIDYRSDIYSLGIMLYELVTSHSPFKDKDANAYLTMVKHLKHNAPLISEFNPHISPAFNYVVIKALAKNPRERYQTAAELKQDLETLQADTIIDVTDHPDLVQIVTDEEVELIDEEPVMQHGL